WREESTLTGGRPLLRSSLPPDSPDLPSCRRLPPRSAPRCGMRSAGSHHLHARRQYRRRGRRVTTQYAPCRFATCAPPFAKVEWLQRFSAAVSVHLEEIQNRVRDL